MKRCLRCSKEFASIYPNKRYCSSECQRGWFTCEQCGCRFLRKPPSQGRFCSRICRNAAPRPYRVATCLVCGEEYRQRKQKSKFCSESCARVGRRKPRGLCERCGGPIPLTSKKEARFCSRICSRGAQGSRKGKSNSLPEGHKRINGGYVFVKRGGKFVREHRHVMEQLLGRALDPNERVHHKNGDRTDNTSENLELWKVGTKDPSGIRANDYHCHGCQCGTDELLGLLGLPTA